MCFFTYQDHRFYYEETGAGMPLLLLHGNTASGKMFAPVIPLFAGKHRVIAMDFLGCGRSDRLEMWPTDLWYKWGEQAAALCAHLGLRKVNVIGCSGGALAAINLALSHPELVRAVVADSFEGERALPIVTDSLSVGREASKQDAGARMFYELMNGENWEQVVDADTQAILAHAAHVGNFFHEPLSELKPDILLTGSRVDAFCAGDFFDNLFSDLLHKIGHGKKHIFECGGHPAMMSNAEAFASLCDRFFDGQM